MKPSHGEYWQKVAIAGFWGVLVALAVIVFLWSISDFAP